MFRERRKMQVWQLHFIVCALREAPKWRGAATTSIKPTLQGTASLYVRQFNPKVPPSLVKQNPCKWAQLPQLPRLSNLWKDEQSLSPVSTQYIPYPSQATKPSASTFSKQSYSFNSWYQCLHLQQGTSGSLFCATQTNEQKHRVYLAGLLEVSPHLLSICAGGHRRWSLFL